MTRRIQSLLQGMGGIFVFMPHAGARPVILRDRTARLQRPWMRTGQAFRRAVERFEREQKTKT